MEKGFLKGKTHAFYTASYLLHIERFKWTADGYPTFHVSFSIVVFEKAMRLLSMFCFELNNGIHTFTEPSHTSSNWDITSPRVFQDSRSHTKRQCKGIIPLLATPTALAFFPPVRGAPRSPRLHLRMHFVASSFLYACVCGYARTNFIPSPRDWIIWSQRTPTLDTLPYGTIIPR
jgi:hypothetical protein